MGLCGNVEAPQLRFRDDYEGALHAYLQRDFRAAHRQLKELGTRHPGERSVNHLLERCAVLERLRPADVQPEMLSL